MQPTPSKPLYGITVPARSVSVRRATRWLFQNGEGIHRAGSQGVPLLESPFLAEMLAGLSRLSALDSAGQALLREWAYSLMALLGFASVQLLREGVRDDGYYAYLNPLTGACV